MFFTLLKPADKLTHTRTHTQRITKLMIGNQFCSELVEDYNADLAKLAEKLMKVLSTNLGLEENQLQQALGGEEVGASLRVNFYPKCPQPDLTLGLSPHSDPGALTLLLADNNVSGLQVRKGESWITIKPAPNAFIVNIGDQVQVYYILLIN